MNTESTVDWKSKIGLWRIPMILLMLLMLGGYSFTTVTAEPRACRDVNQITICGDAIDEFAATFNGGGFRVRGNVTLGPKGGAAVVAVGNTGSIFDGSVLPENISTASYIHVNQADPNTGTTDFIIGEVRFINDPTGLALFGTTVFDHAPAGGEVTAGRLFVDTTNRRIFLPAAGAVPIFTQRGVKRNEAFRLNFISRIGAQTFYKNGGSVDELTGVNGEFDLNTKKFKAVVPIALKLGDSAENPNLVVTMRAEFSENGALSAATVDGFKFKLGGLLMDASGVAFKGIVGSAPAEFEAALVKVLKTDNPNVPNLDPTDPTLVFAFSKLKYANAQWSIGGVEVGVKEWVFGNSFKMTNQTLGLINEGVIQSLQIKSTMQFGSGADASKLPVVLKVGRADAGGGLFKPVFQAGLTNFSPKLGVMTFKLQNALFVGDAAQNFWGIKAANVDLQWPAYLGGKTAAGVGNFELGIGNDRKVKFKLGNGTVGLPQLENKVFTANLQATVGVVSDTVTITGTGTFSLKLPGNGNAAGIVGQAVMKYNRDINATPGAAAQAQVQASDLTALPCRNVTSFATSCPSSGPPPLPAGGSPAFVMQLAGFEVKIAGFKFTITSPRGLDDGGFAADNVALALPTGLSIQNPPAGGLSVQGIAVTGDGNVLIAGGGFELPPVSVGSVQLVALRGSFATTTDGNYEFRAGGKLPMPGTEPGTGSSGITLDVVVRTNTTGAFAGMGVTVEIFSPPLPKIPLGATGLVLTRVQGSFDLTNGTSTIGLGVTAESQYGIPLGGLGTLPILTSDGNITAQFNPFKFSGNVSLKVLIFQVANAAVNIGAGQGFDNGNGMNAQVQVNAIVIKGLFKVRAGKGIASDPNKRRFAASAQFDLGIVKNQFGTGLPPFNLGGQVITLGGGIFKDNNFSPARETLGIKGTYDGILLNFGIFIDLQASTGGSGFFKVRNLDKYVLIPAEAVRAAAANGVEGFGSRLLSAEEVTGLGLVVAADADGVLRVLQDVIPIQNQITTTLVAGISYTVGAPSLRLKFPNGSEITPATVNNVTTGYMTSTDATGTNAFFIVKGAVPGSYQLLVDNAPAVYEDVSYTLNDPPKVTISNVTCGGANVSGVTVTCANTVNGAAAMAPDASGATVTWSSSDTDSAGTTISVGYAADTGDPDAIGLADVTILVDNKPMGAGSHTENLSEIGSGAYRMVVIADDDVNGAVLAVSDVVVTVTDSRAPAVPGGLTATPQAGELLIKWNQNGERDLAGYEIGFGLVNNPAQFVYTRNMGPKEIITGTNNIVDAKIWGLADNTTVFYGLRAYDGSGNYSNWTPLQSAKPWALSPDSWTPVPGGKSAGNVEIAFGVPMKIATLETALTVKDGNGAVIPGSTYLIVNLSGTKVLGIGFEPNDPVRGPATATLKGGPGGVQAEDGRTMGGDYVWSFSVQPNDIFLPLASR